jgi:tRNA A-37 threonylcarbamoyl transferase component Bud32
MTTAPNEPTLIRRAEETPTVQLVSMADALTPGAILGGRYRIVSLLGRGGMGEVYRADDLRLGQPVALKFLTRQTTIDERLLHEEVRIGRQVSHPNVCRLYDIEEVDGRIFIAMEYVDGEDLAALLRRVGRLSPDKALSVARDLCAGLAAAHELRVIHRDLKPGNVLIDGRGRARVTDFGLAVEHEKTQSAAGTPAYMAPEQLAGHRATVQSDLYSLGLVLYEVFTGRRAIDGTSLGDISTQQREQRFLRPSALVPDIDPNVEEAILRCLDPDPMARPSSVHELVRELPGFDPVAAALAAGETPSAGMVAASAKSGDLSVRAAWTLFAIAVAGLLAAAATAPLSMVVSSGRAKPPAVLLERAKDVLSAAGITALPDDRGFTYWRNDSSTAAPIEFIYRESPGPMLTRTFDRRLTADHPAFVWPGMSLVRLDGDGRLLEFASIPPKRASGAAQPSFDWSQLLALTRIDASALVPAAPEMTARSDSDAKRAWTVTGSGKRIEAASYRGQPVWLAVVEPSHEATRTDTWLAGLIQTTLLIILPAAVLLIAWRNQRRGSSDRRGAFRLSLFFFALTFVITVLRMHHPSSFTMEWLSISLAMSEDLFFAIILGVAYVAIEPLVRRRWPEMLISWSRLLGGRWKDPMVGRDILIGSTIGVGIALAQRMTAIAPRWMGIPTESLRDTAAALDSPRHLASSVLAALPESIFRSMFALVLLLLLRAVVRRMDVAAALAIVICTAFFMSDATGPLAVRFAFGLCVGLAVYAILLRFGLLALVATGFVATVLFDVPLTLDTSSWYFAHAAAVLLVLGAMAAFGFHSSLAGKRWLPRLSM